jgi:hypothetical protein
MPTPEEVKKITDYIDSMNLPKPKPMPTEDDIKKIETFVSETTAMFNTEVPKPTELDRHILADKQLRVVLDEILQRLKDLPASRERALSITKLQEAIMWLGMDLKRLGTPNPYPHSREANTIVDPTADGLKL